MSSENKGLEKNTEENIDTYLTNEERRQLLANLHRFLAWVGVQLPAEFETDKELIKTKMGQYYLTEEDIPPETQVDKGTIYLHDLIWRLINNKELTEKEKLEVNELIHILETKQKDYEEMLKEANLTRSQAKQLYNETAGVIRALLDLKELLSPKKSSEFKRESVHKKVEDARRWNAFMEQVKK